MSRSTPSPASGLTATLAPFAALASFAAGVALAPSAASAHAPTSKYTRVAAADCLLVEEDVEYARWSCPGSYAGVSVDVVYGDVRTTLLFEKDGREVLLDATPITGGAFNSIGDVLEWRGVETGGRFTPTAFILRWFRSEPVGDGFDWYERPLLGVLKFDGERACVVGRVDASTVADANARARALADTHARGFTCGVDTPVNVK